MTPETGEGKEGILKNGFGFCVLLLYFYLGMYGCLYGFLSVFPVFCKEPILFIGILITGIFYTMLYLTRRYFAVALFLTALTYVWLIYYNITEIHSGWNDIGDVVGQVINLYGMATYDAAAISGGDASHVTMCLLAIIFLWSGMLFFGLMVRGGRVISVLSMVVILSGGLAVGRIPWFISICLMVLCVIGAFSTDGLETIEGQKNGALLMTVLSLVLMAAGGKILTPVIKPWFSEKEEIRTRIQNGSLMQELANRMSDLNTSWAVAGIGNGDLGNTDFVTSTNKKVMEVFTDNRMDETIYLKCYTGREYNGVQWKAENDEREAQVKKDYFQNLALTAEGYGIMTPLYMEVEIKNGEMEYAYEPYFSKLDIKEDDGFTYNYFKRSDADNWYWDGTLGTQGDEDYRSYVYENYISFPSQRLERLREVCASNPQESVAGIQSYIIEFLHGNATYNINAGKTPKDQDFVENFLFEKHEGFCVHFATAATLMFRIYGIPARYATGYVVPADDFYQDGQGYRADVVDARAHAWTEIYINGQGWIPVEATPGYTQGAGVEATETDIQPGVGGERRSESRAESTPQSGTHPPGKNEENSSSAKIPGWVAGTLGGILLLGLLALGIVLRRRWVLMQRRRAGVRKIFWDIFQAMEFAGFPKNIDCEDEGFLKEAMGRFEWMEEEPLIYLVELAMRANFGKGPIFREDTVFAQEMYWYICKNIYQGLSGVRKLVFRYVFAYF